MNPETFLKPSREELEQLAKNETLEDIYTTSIALVDGLLCEFSPTRVGPQFRDEGTLLAKLFEFTEPIGGVSEPIPGDAIQNNLVANLEAALRLRRRCQAYRGGRGRKALLAEVEGFLDALIETYGEILELMRGGVKAPRARRA